MADVLIALGSYHTGCDRGDCCVVASTCKVVVAVKAAIPLRRTAALENILRSVYVVRIRYCTDSFVLHVISST